MFSMGCMNGIGESVMDLPSRTRLFLVSAIFVLSCGQNNSSSPPFIVEDDVSLSNDPSAIEPGLYTQTIEHNGTQRSYILYVPQNFDSTDPTPLVFNFHGFGGNAETQLARANLRPLADRDGVILIYPNGSILDGDQSWNVLLPSATNKSDADDFGFIDAILERETARLNIAADRVYATGYSNGAGFSYALACQRNQNIAAIAPVSGAMWYPMVESCAPTRSTSVMIFNGTLDFERPYDGIDGYLLPVEDAAQYWVNYNGINSAPVETTFQHQSLQIERQLYASERSDVQVILHKVNGGGHDWFALAIEGNSLNEIIWNFFVTVDGNRRMASGLTNPE